MEKILGKCGTEIPLVVTPWFILYGDNYYTPLNFEKVRDTLNITGNAFDHEFTNSENFVYVEYKYGFYSYLTNTVLRITLHPIINDECKFNICNLYWIDAIKNADIPDGDSIYNYNDTVKGNEDISDTVWNNISRFETFIYLWNGQLILTEDRFQTYINLGTYSISQIIDIDQKSNIITLYHGNKNITDVVIAFDSEGKYVDHSVIERNHKFLINGFQIKNYISTSNFTFGTDESNLLTVINPAINGDHIYSPMITKMPATSGTTGYDYYFTFMMYDSMEKIDADTKHGFSNHEFKIAVDGTITHKQNVTVYITENSGNDTLPPYNHNTIYTSLRSINSSNTEFIYSQHGTSYNLVGISTINNIGSVDLSVPNTLFTPQTNNNQPVTMTLLPYLKTYNMCFRKYGSPSSTGYMIYANNDSTFTLDDIDTTIEPSNFIDYQDRLWDKITSSNKLIVHNSKRGKIRVYPKNTELQFNADDINSNVPLTQRGTMNVFTVEQTGDYNNDHDTVKVSLKISDDESYFVTDDHVAPPVVSGAAVKVYNLEIEYGTKIDIAVMLMNANKFDIHITDIGPNDPFPDAEEISAEIYSGKIYSPQIMNMTYIILDKNTVQQSVYPYAQEVYTLADHKIISMGSNDNSITDILNMPNLITKEYLNTSGDVFKTDIMTHKTDSDGVFYYKNPDDIILINLFGIFIPCTVKNLIHLSDFKPFVGLYDVRMLNALRLLNEFNAYANATFADGYVYINDMTDNIRINSINDLKNIDKITEILSSTASTKTESDLISPFDMFEILKNLLSKRNYNIYATEPKISIYSSNNTVQEGTEYHITVHSNVKFPDSVKVKLNAVVKNYVPDYVAEGKTTTSITFNNGIETFDSNNEVHLTVNIADNNFNNMHELIANTITIYDANAFANDYGIWNYYGVSKTYKNQAIPEKTRGKLLIESGIDYTFIPTNLSNGFIADSTNIYSHKIFNSELHDELKYVLINYLDDNTESFARIHTNKADISKGEEVFLVVDFDNYPQWNERAYVTIRFTDAVLGHQVFGVETFSLAPGTLTYNYHFKCMFDGTDDDYSFNVELVSVWVGDYKMSLVSSPDHNAGRLITYNVTSKEPTDDDDRHRFGTFFTIYPCDNLQFSYADEYDADVNGSGHNYTTQETDGYSGIYTFNKNKPVVWRIGSLILGDISLDNAEYSKSYMSPMNLFANDEDKSINSLKVNNINRILLGLNINSFDKTLSVDLDTSKTNSLSYSRIDWSDSNAVALLAGTLGITLPDAGQTYLSFRRMMMTIYGEHNLDPMITVSTQFVTINSDGTYSSVDEFIVGNPVYLIANVNSIPTEEVRVLLSITSPLLVEGTNYSTSSHQVIIPAGVQSSNAIEINMIIPEDYTNSLNYYGTLNSTVNTILHNPTGTKPGGFPYINTTDESNIKIKDYVNVML